MRGLRTIASRATVKNRRRVIADTLPYVVTPATISGYVVRSVYGEEQFFVVVGTTLTATPGVWSDANGVPSVIGRWLKWDDTPASAENVTSFVVPEDAPVNTGFGYYWVEIATQGGRSEVSFSNYVEVLSPVSAPIFNGWLTGNNAPVFGGSHAVGATVTRPDIAWWSEIPIASRVGQWYKNDVATGVTSATYSDTAEGDTLAWDEVATDVLGAASTPYLQTQTLSRDNSHFYVSDRITAMAADSVSWVESRISGKTPADAQHLFDNTTANWASDVFVPNVELWCQDLREQLTGFHMFVDGGWFQSYGMSAITPRHMISCAHGGPQPGKFIRFVSTTGEVFQTTLLKWVNDSPSHAHRVNVPQLALEADLSVYLLADQLPSWVYKAPVLDLQPEMLGIFTGGGGLCIAVSQGSWTSGPAISNTPRNRKVYPKRADNRALPDHIAPFYHDVQVGDSGSPEFILYDGRLYLYHIITSGGGGGWPILDYRDYVNAMIARADAAAGISTGYTLNISSSLRTGPEPITTAAGEPITLVDDFVLTRTI